MIIVNNIYSVGNFSNYIEIAKSTKRNLFVFTGNGMCCFDDEYGSACYAELNQNYTEIMFYFNSGILSPTYLPLKNYIETSKNKNSILLDTPECGYIIPEENIGLFEINKENNFEESPSGYLISEGKIVPYVRVETRIPTLVSISINNLNEIYNMVNSTNCKLYLDDFEKREDYQAMYNSKVSDGNFRFFIDNQYVMILYKSFLPAKKNETISLEIIPMDEDKVKFLTHFIIHKKPSKLYNDLHIYSFMLNLT